MEKYKEYEKIAENITLSTLDKLRGITVNKVVGEKPNKKFIIGSLSPEYKTYYQVSSFADIQRRSYPRKVGFSFLISNVDLSNYHFKLTYSFDIFYRLIPTLTEQKNMQINREVIEPYENLDEEELPEEIHDSDNEDEKNLDSIEEPVIKPDIVNKIDSRFRLIRVFRKYKVSPKTIIFNFEKELNLNEYRTIVTSKEIIKQIHEEIGKCKRIWTIPEDHSWKKWDFELNKDEECIIEKVKSVYQEPILPNWEWEISYRILPYRGHESFENNKDLFKVEICWTNLSKENSLFGEESVDLTLYNTELSMNVPQNLELVPRTIIGLENNYKYDPRVYGWGYNCHVGLKKDNYSTTLLVEHTPIFKEFRYESSSEFLDERKFDSLILNPIKNLEGILNGMNNFKTQSKHILVNHCEQKQFDYQDIYKSEQFRIDQAKFDNEINRFSKGIESLRNYDLALRAFKFMNIAFKNASTHSTWRLFQLVFIVMNIGDLCDFHLKERDECESLRNEIDLLYYPTGGGKTEAYLGVSVFNAFLDRLRGKKCGTSTIIRFPLRLLSVQQMQRSFNIFAKAEIIREKEFPTSDEFSVAYLVGATNIPNKFNDARITEVLKMNNLNAEKREFSRFRGIDDCPFCDSKNSLETTFDRRRKRLKHLCTICNRKIPLYTVDEEIYRNIPTFIVTTLDKIALLGWNKSFKSLFGFVRNYCPDHGYSTMKFCDTLLDNRYCRYENEIDDFIDPPSLLIHDELHLIREGLGSFASHYETLLEEILNQVYIQKYGFSKPTKIIAATATISDYQSQCDHLYVKKAEIFPHRVPLRTHNFYSKISKEVGRYITGIMPRNKSPIFVNIDILQAYQETIADFSKDLRRIKSKFDIDLELNDLKSALELYQIMVSYALAKKDANQLLNSIDNQLNILLRSRGYESVYPKLVTGDRGFKDILDLIRIIKTRSEGINLVIATNMISHGVDLENLNFIVFRGMPRNVAEYIQAYSRVGRTFPGIVFLALNHGRERDVSYYPYFKIFHKYKDELVDPVPLNRWASQVINSTQNGIILAAILNYLTARKDFGTDLTKMYLTGGYYKAKTEIPHLTDEIKNFVINALKIEDNQDLITSISKRIQQFDNDFIKNRDVEPRDSFLANFISPKPMNSLRNTDKLVEITTDIETSKISAFKV